MSMSMCGAVLADIGL